MPKYKDPLDAVFALFVEFLNLKLNYSNQAVYKKKLLPYLNGKKTLFSGRRDKESISQRLFN